MASIKRIRRNPEPATFSMMQYPAELEIEPYPKPVDATVSVPGSKSITNRALVLAALSGGSLVLEGALQSEDTELMVDALRQLGYALEADWPNAKITFTYQERPLIPAKSADLFVGNSGTSMRFLTAMLAAGEGRWRIDGIPRMRERPIEDLLDALNQFEGVKAVSESGNGCPPVVIESTGMKVGERRIQIKADVSSQFLSALLMAAPFAKEPVVLQVEGTTVSEPYIHMTLAMMRDWGYPVVHQGSIYRVPLRSQTLPSRQYAIEPDASAASYFFAAAAITGGRVTVRGMKRNMLQGDVKFVDALEMMGCRIEHSDEGITVFGGPLRGIDIDMNAISDTVMTLAAVACFAEGPTTIRNVGHIRHKETDRIAAVANELRKLGATVEEHSDGMTIVPGPLRGARVETYNDHRMAMSLALVGLRVPDVVILNPGCVAKTYPGFWADFSALRS
jgi:3-phosphoshikimate 1-carboxyvinyltransferase